MRFPPPEVIASWPTPNYTNPESRGSALVIIMLTITPLALICLALRMYVRVHMVKKAWWDDWLMVAAAVFSCGESISVILGNQLYGWNNHVWDLTFQKMIQGRQVSIASQTIYLLASGLTRLSILVSYLRIALPRFWFWRLTWVTIAVVATYIPVFELILWLQCRPASAYWDLLSDPADCISELPPLLGNTVITVVTDFIVYILPMPTLWHLNLPLTQRISLMVLFGLGAVVVIAGCERMYWTYYVEADTYDVTWDGFYVWTWLAVEVNLGVICGCAPVLKAIIFPHRSRSSKGNSSRDQSSHVPTIGSRRSPWARKKRLDSGISVEHNEEYINLESHGARNGIESIELVVEPNTGNGLADPPHPAEETVTPIRPQLDV